MCGDVVLAIYGPETTAVDDVPTQPTAAVTSQLPAVTSQLSAADSRMTSTAAKSVEINVPEILVHN